MSCSCDEPWSADVAALLDLDRAPFTVRRSRLLVRHAEGQGPGVLDVLRAAYERSLADSVLVRGLEVRDGADALVVPDRACAACVHLGPVTLTVTDTDVLSIGDLPAGWSLRLRLEEPEVERELGLPSGSGRLRGKGVELDAGADGVVCVRSPVNWRWPAWGRSAHRPRTLRSWPSRLASPRRGWRVVHSSMPRTSR
jgi:hypothetical protein